MTTPVENPAARILAGPELAVMQFQKLDQGAAPAEAEARVRFEMGIVRLGAVEIIVQLTCFIEDPPYFVATISYRAAFGLVAPPPEGAPREAVLRDLCAGTAPSVIFPFIREMATSLCARAGIGLRILPVVNFAEIFAPGDIAVPPVDADESPAS